MPQTKDAYIPWLNTALAIFFLVAVMGTLMRLIYILPIPFLDFKHILHAHSHVAMLGWAFLIISGCMLFLVLRAPLRRAYSVVFIANMVSTVGMLISFTLQGYGFYSIAFSTLHLLTAYVFAFYYYKDLKDHPPSSHKTFLQWALFWMILSTLGIWSVGPISVLAGKASASFHMAIQFFLHFQFNGWFTYAILGIWLYHIHTHKTRVVLPGRYILLLHLSLLLTYALSVTWSTPVSAIFYLNSAGVLLQLLAVSLILNTIFKQSNPFRQIQNLPDLLLALGVSCLIIKVFVQVAVAVPVVAEISYTIRNYVIGFIHLIMLGSVSFTAIAILLKNNFLPVNKMTAPGWIILAAGFILKELLLFGQGTMLWLKQGFMPFYHEIILIITSLLPVGLALVLVGQMMQKSLIISQINNKNQQL